MRKPIPIAVLSAAIAAPAPAQFWDGPVFDASMHSQAMLNTALTTLNTSMVDRAVKRQQEQGQAFTAPPPPKDAPAPKSSATAANGSYKPDPAVRRRLAEAMARKAAESGPTQEGEMRQMVLSGEAVRQYEKVAPQLGLRPNNAIDGLAFYMLSQWGVANDYREMFTRAQAAGVRRQAAASFASVGAQVNSDAQRQEFGEMLMVQGAIMSGVFETAVNAGDDDAAARYAALAREGGKAIFKMDPTEIALTDDGFQPR